MRSSLDSSLNAYKMCWKTWKTVRYGDKVDQNIKSVLKCYSLSVMRNDNKCQYYKTLLSKAWWKLRMLSYGNITVQLLLDNL